MKLLFIMVFRFFDGAVARGAKLSSEALTNIAGYFHFTSKLDLQKFFKRGSLLG
jgi:hypothetical protein